MSYTTMNETEAVVAAARAGDESAFSALTERYRRELHVHCYRMLGSFEDAEDAVQECYLRAWRKRATFQGRSTFRAWLYRIATNACLDALERRPRVAQSSDVSWLQPYPDHLLEELAPSEAEPEAAVVAKETIELAFLVAIQHLAPRPRAVLILRDVLGWSAKDTAALLDTSVASANSALQRSRAAVKQHLPERRSEWSAEEASEAERALVQRYVEASERIDAAGVAALMHEDARFSMPPESEFFEGRDTIKDAWVRGGFQPEVLGEMRCLPIAANRQPAVACYLREPGEAELRLLALDVLRIEDGAIAEIVAFTGDALDAFDLPPTL